MLGFQFRVLEGSIYYRIKVVVFDCIIRVSRELKWNLTTFIIMVHGRMQKCTIEAKNMSETKHGQLLLRYNYPNFKALYFKYSSYDLFDVGLI